MPALSRLGSGEEVESIETLQIIRPACPYPRNIALNALQGVQIVSASYLPTRIGALMQGPFKQPER